MRLTLAMCGTKYNFWAQTTDLSGFFVCHSAQCSLCGQDDANHKKKQKTAISALLLLLARDNNSGHEFIYCAERSDS